MTSCPATLADRGRVPCTRTDPHDTGHVYQLIDGADRVHHDHLSED